MAQITEDYVSFETAKLLKEKGFDEIIFTWYTGKGKFCVGKNNFDDYYMNHFSNMATAKDKNKCSAPTLQMAMKWLREEKNLFIGIEPRLSHTDYSYITAYIYHTKKKHSYYHEDNIIEYDSFAQCDADSFESACERAIKYCLDYLVK